MNNQRLGCFTPLGISAALITLLIIAGFGVAQGGILFSPGQLNAQAGNSLGNVQSHAGLSANCAACHSAPWDPETMSLRCLACHSSVKEEIIDPKTLHGQMIHNSAQAECRNCHTEHHGVEGQLTRLDMSGFQHEVTGFSLKGHVKLTNGQPFQCKDCHMDSFNNPVKAACTDCHAQIDSAYLIRHTIAFGQDCLNCHDGLDTFGKAFDHNKTSFPLTGKHSLQPGGTPDCQDCHLNKISLVALKDTPTICAACHQKDDAHQGRLGEDCAACHTPNAWKPASFDHAKSAFPLTGAHISVQCAACHVNQVFKGTHTDCFACHALDDHHTGRFGQDCAACHATSGWLPATFDHAKSGFLLTGAHASLPCQRCHTSGFQQTTSECSGCHQDPAYHAGIFPANCAACHTTTAWAPAQFTGSHPFPTNHGGANTCKDCHTSSLGTYTCYTCHNQVEMTRKHQEEGIIDLSSCTRCHQNAGGGGN